MPLTTRVVEPVRICQINHMTNPSAELSSEQNTHNLEETNYIALVGVMRQLCDIATFAEEMFTNLHNIAKDTVERTNKLHTKVKNLNECLINNTEFELSGPASGPGLVAKKQSLFYKDTRPSAIKLKYAEMEKTPPLHQFLDLMSVDDIDQGTQPHKLYSDPALFFTAWVDLMEKENREFKKSRKRSFKKTAKEAQISKIATLKKKVHDPKTKRYVMVDLEPQYATLKGARANVPAELPLSATLNRKKYGDAKPQPGTAAAETSSNTTTTTTTDSYLSPNRQSTSFDENNYRQCSTPISTSTPDTENQTRSTSEIEISVPSITSPVIDQQNSSTIPAAPPPPPAPPAPLPPPLQSPLPPPSPGLPPPPTPLSAPPLTPVENAPPPFLPPPVPEDAIKPEKMSDAQRILRTKEIPEAKGRETLLDMIRSSSFNLKPVEFKQPEKEAEPTYASWGGRDVASILQRRKMLMGAGDNSDYSSGSDSDGDGRWD